MYLKIYLFILGAIRDSLVHRFIFPFLLQVVLVLISSILISILNAKAYIPETINYGDKAAAFNSGTP